MPHLQRLLAPLLAALLCLVLAGCEEPPVPAAAQDLPSTKMDATRVVKPVPPAARSSAFGPVAKHLDFGGEFFAYADFEGDYDAALRFLDDYVKTIQQTAPILPGVNIKAILGPLGLQQIRAAGASSYSLGDGMYRNRIFLYTPDGRAGLLKALGGKPASFQAPAIAPADSGFLFETEASPSAIYDTAIAIAKEAAGQVGIAAVDRFLSEQAKPTPGSSLMDLLKLQSLRVFAFGRIADAPDQALLARAPDDPNQIFVSRKPNALLGIIDAGPLAAALAKDLAKMDYFKTERKGAWQYFTDKEGTLRAGYKPTIAISDSRSIYFAFSPEYIDEALSAKTRLADSKTFKAALDGLPKEGNELSYADPKLLKSLQDVFQQATTAARQPSFHWLFPGNLARPIVSVRANQQNGILVVSTGPNTCKVAIAQSTVVIPGLFAAMAIPAFNKVRDQSQEKAILNNLRLLNMVAEQHMVEKGVKKVRYSDIVGPGKPLPSIKPVAGEDYSRLTFESGAELSVTTQTGKVVRHKMD